MSEISREDAIKNLNTFIEFMKDTQTDSDNPYFWSKEDYLSFAKAISDMEKLEKIEQIIDDMLNTCRSDEYHNEGYKIMLLQLKTLNKIEQIVRGGENE